MNSVTGESRDSALTGIHSIRKQQRCGNISNDLERQPVIFLGLLLIFGELMLVLDGDPVRDD